ncbi:MAG TPA: type III pantothenate kinase [Saprospiraceae bacterium]|nr:type III pantothenate kinase [Saprospiraceae bacterium]HMQ84202.1 type III pantothenate kinase [Saprospiraceae bacterium]
MNLAIDIGNTRVKMGIFDQDQLLQYDVVEKLPLNYLTQWLTNHSIQNIIYCSVGKVLDQKLQAFLDQHALFLDAHTPIPVTNHYQTPATLGKDRLAAVVGAFALFPETNCIVVDAGSCITCDVLKKGGHYLGGNISPGIKMRLKAMHEFTAALPLVEPGELRAWIGDSTTAALRNGAQLGAIFEVMAFVDYLETHYGDFQVIITGGDAEYFVKNLKREIFVHQNLVLAGLNQILKHNVD